MRQRLEELGSPRMSEPRPLVRERGVDLEPRRVDDRLGLLGVDRAHRVDDRPSLAHALRCSAEQLELELGERLGSPAQVGSLVEHSEARARSIDERAVEVAELGRKVSGRQRRRPERWFYRADVWPPRARVLALRSARPQPHRRAASSPCLPARRRDRGCARPRANRPRERRAATRRSAARSGLRPALARPRGRRATLPERPDRALPGSLRKSGARPSRPARSALA